MFDVRTSRWTAAALLGLGLSCGGLLMAGCEDDGPAEEAGEAIDEAAEDAQEALEDAAEEVEDAVDDDEPAYPAGEGGG